jgi:hypothetical protein
MLSNALLRIKIDMISVPTHRVWCNNRSWLYHYHRRHRIYSSFDVKILKTSFIKNTESPQLEECWKDSYSDTKLDRIFNNNVNYAVLSTTGHFWAKVNTEIPIQASISVIFYSCS